jgi:BUD22
MPKRKRSTYDDDGDRVQDMRKQDVQDAFAKARKQLRQALKTSKGFERQKLGKRLKLATAKGDAGAIARIRLEIEALKGIDLDALTKTHLHKSLLKIKAFAENENLPDEVKMELPKPEGDDGTITALRNVTSGMYNMKQVKEAMAQIMNRMYIAMGIPAPAQREKGVKKMDVKSILKDGRLKVTKMVEDVGTGQKEESGIGESELAWDGFDSREDEEVKQEDDKIKQEDRGGAESIDKEEIARYDDLIGGSSDEESFDEKTYFRDVGHLRTAGRLSLSSSPTTSTSSTPSRSPSITSSPEPEQTKSSKPPKPKTGPSTRPGLSTFLPTLIGGYWSGSESSASDIDDAAPVKKNRPGQMARRAIWEKKYGEKANHIKSGQGPVGKSKDDGWDAKRGAKEASSRRGGFSVRGGRDGGWKRTYDQATGENAIAVEPKKRGMGKKDDVGVLHPSWQAAKKAKEAKKTATFQGKKVTFD